MVFRRLIGMLVASSLFLLVGLSTALAEPGIERVEPGGAPPPGSGTVETSGFVRGIDGDTMELDYNGSKAGVGVIGIEAPQANTACGLEAANQLQAMIINGVRLEEDPEIAFDRERGLRMYYAIAPDGRSVAEELVKAGVVRATGEGRDSERLAALETEARDAKRGCLWGGETPGGEQSQRQAVEGPQDGLAIQAADENQISAAAVADFTEEVVAHQLNRPTSFAFLPDGRILIAEQGGTVRVFKNGSLLPTPFIDISDQVNDYWDRGLLDVAVDPNFAQNGYVYLLFTYENDPAQYEGSKTARLIRVTASGDTAAPSSESVILGKTIGSSCKNFPANTDCIPSDYYSHTVGTVEFASDGNMFITTGDASDFTRVSEDSLRAQDLDSLAGKVLHVTPSGQGIPTNPYFTGNADDNRSKVWAYGVRNAFRMNLRPGTDVPYIGDVGWGSWEEINVASKGSNLGWPCYEGSARQTGWEPYPVCQTLYGQGTSAVKPPLTEWNHDGGGAAAVGGTFYTGTKYPAEYQGTYFYGDFARGWLRYLRTDTNDQLVGTPIDFLSNNSTMSPVDIEMGDDGNLYYLNIYSADLRRILYTGTSGEVICPRGEYLAEYFSNKTLSGEPVFKRCETSIQNDWGEGAPPDTGVGADDFSVRWTGDFDFEAGDHRFSATADDGIRAFVDGEQIIDGWRDQGPTLYEATRAMTAGTHQVRVEYYENTHGAVARFGWQETNPNAAPKPTIAEPTADLKWKVGDTINFSGSATDPEDGAIPASDLSWNVVTHHCSPSGDCHAHNLTTATGASGSFQTVNHGADPYYFEIVLTATDSSGKTGKASVDIRPQTTQMTLDTSPAGLQVVFGGQAGTAPLTRTVAVGSSFSIQAPSPQGGYAFESWSDGGAQQHDVTAGATDVTYTANFTTSDTATCLKGEYLAEYFDNETLSGTPVASRCEANIDYDWVDQAPIAGVGANNFSVRWTGDFDFEAADYRFSATADDGIRAFVDGEQVIDGWRDQPATQYEATRAAMTAGTHQVKVEYYEKFGDASARFNWRKAAGQVSCAKGEYLAEYFDNETLSGTPVASRCEANIDYDWVDQAPIAGVGANNFSVRWTGDFDFEAGDHRFSATADDGIRAFVDGEQVIDGWRDQPATQYEATRAAMTAGTHQVKVEYYEKFGDASARFNWIKTTDSAAPDTSITAGPSNLENQSSATFEFSSSEPGFTFECKLDDGPYAACESPKTYSSLSDGLHAFSVRATDAAGNTDESPASRTWSIDATAPVASAPQRSLIADSPLGTSTIPIRLSWSATDGGSGVVSYQLQQSVNGGTFTDVSLADASVTSTEVSLNPNSSYAFRVRAQDKAGNQSQWAAGPSFMARTIQQDSSAIGYVGKWNDQKVRNAYGGSLKYASGAGTERATFGFTGDEVAWIATKAANRGIADVYIDGAKVATVDLYASSTQDRKVVFSRSLSPGNHTLQISVLGTKNPSSSGRRVDVDAFIVMP